MHRFISCGLVGIVCGFTPAVARPVIEDFEHGNVALWPLQTQGSTMTIDPAAAHDGSLGAQYFSGPSEWRTRFDIVTSPGNKYRLFVRCRGGEHSGRIYFGVGSSQGGTLSAVFAPNSDEILIQSNSGYTEFNDLRSAVYHPALNTWYVLEFDWGADTRMVARLLDESATTVLAETSPLWGTPVPGGMALRGFTGNWSAPVYNDADTISVIEGCYPDCDGSGTRNVNDFICFQTAFATANPYADCNRDTILNVNDYICFQTSFALGCP